LPAGEHPDPERDEDERDDGLERGRDRRRDLEVQRDERGAEREDRHGVADAPREARQGGPVSVLDERGHGGHVVGLDGVFHAEGAPGEECCRDHTGRSPDGDK